MADYHGSWLLRWIVFLDTILDRWLLVLGTACDHGFLLYSIRSLNCSVCSPMRCVLDTCLLHTWRDLLMFSRYLFFRAIVCSFLLDTMILRKRIWKIYGYMCAYGSWIRLGFILSSAAWICLRRRSIQRYVSISRHMYNTQSLMFQPWQVQILKRVRNHFL